MKVNSALLLHIALLHAGQAIATCVEGQKETISPGYEIEYKCDIYRTGTPHPTKLNTAAECVGLCRDPGLSVCSYFPGTKRCVLGDENGVDKPRAGVYYMKKVVEDPFAGDEKDPFADDCQEGLDACESDKTNLEADKTALESEKATLETDKAKCRSDLAASKRDMEAYCPRDHNKEIVVAGKTYKGWCTRYHDPTSPRESHSNIITFTQCVDLCSARSWCTYALHGCFQTKCDLHSRAVAYTQMPGIANNMWNCAVKK